MFSVGDFILAVNDISMDGKSGHDVHEVLPNETPVLMKRQNRGGLWRIGSLLIVFCPPQIANLSLWQ